MASQFDTLTTDVGALSAQVGALQTALTKGIGDLQAEIAALKQGTPSIAPQLAGIEAATASLQQAVAQITGADPGSQPSPSSPSPA